MHSTKKWDALHLRCDVAIDLLVNEAFCYDNRVRAWVRS